MYFFLY